MATMNDCGNVAEVTGKDAPPSIDELQAKLKTLGVRSISFHRECGHAYHEYERDMRVILNAMTTGNTSPHAGIGDSVRMEGQRGT